MFDVVNTRIQLHNCAEHLANQLNKRVAPVLHKGSVHVTRGNDLRLEKSHVKYDL